MWKSVATGAILATFMSAALADDAHHPGSESPQSTTLQSGQAVPGTEAMGQGMMGQGMMGPGMMMHCPMMGTMGPGKPHTEGHLAFLKAEFQISSRQEKVWTVYANAVRAIQKRISDRMATMGPGMMMQQGKRQPAPEAIQMHIHMIEARLENLKALQSATAQLYGALNDDQKETADELLVCCMGLM